MYTPSPLDFVDGSCQVELPCVECSTRSSQPDPVTGTKPQYDAAHASAMQLSLPVMYIAQPHCTHCTHCTHTRTHACKRPQTHSRIHTCMQTCGHRHMRTCTVLYTCLCTAIHMCMPNRKRADQINAGNVTQIAALGSNIKVSKPTRIKRKRSKSK